MNHMTEIVTRISGVNPRKCMKCGKCTAACPAYDEMDYHPHQFVCCRTSIQIRQFSACSLTSLSIFTERAGNGLLGQVRVQQSRNLLFLFSPYARGHLPQSVRKGGAEPLHGGDCQHPRAVLLDSFRLEVVPALLPDDRQPHRLNQLRRFHAPGAPLQAGKAAQTHIEPPWRTSPMPSNRRAGCWKTRPAAAQKSLSLLVRCACTTYR